MVAVLQTLQTTLRPCHIATVKTKRIMEEFLHKALFVEDINDDIDLNSVPTSGQEYLKRVM